MRSIDLMVAEGVEDDLLDALEASLTATFRRPVRRRGPLAEPEAALDPGRNQYSSPVLLRALAEDLQEDSFRVLGITDRDIFLPTLTYVFGQAQLGGRVALISLARLRQEFYRIPANPVLTRERACKEAVHELGHTFGLTHCPDRGCGMSLSTTIQHVDLKMAGFCSSCVTLLRESEGRFDVKPASGIRLEDDL